MLPNGDFSDSFSFISVVYFKDPVKLVDLNKFALFNFAVFKSFFV